VDKLYDRGFFLLTRSDDFKYKFKGKIKTGSRKTAISKLKQFSHASTSEEMHRRDRQAEEDYLKLSDAESAERHRKASIKFAKKFDNKTKLEQAKEANLMGLKRFILPEIDRPFVQRLSAAAGRIAVKDLKKML
jgi:hypothetical protein